MIMNKLSKKNNKKNNKRKNKRKLNYIKQYTEPIRYVDTNIGHQLIKSVSCSINGQVIDKWYSPKYEKIFEKIFEKKDPYKIGYLSQYCNHNIIYIIARKLHKYCLTEVHQELIYKSNKYFISYVDIMGRSPRYLDVKLSPVILKKNLT